MTRWLYLAQFDSYYYIVLVPRCDARANTMTLMILPYEFGNIIWLNMLPIELHKLDMWL